MQSLDWANTTESSTASLPSRAGHLILQQAMGHVSNVRIQSVWYAAGTMLQQCLPV